MLKVSEVENFIGEEAAIEEGEGIEFIENFIVIFSGKGAERDTPCRFSGIGELGSDAVRAVAAELIMPPM